MGDKITIKQLMEILGKSRGTIYNYMRDGMPYVKKGRFVYFDKNEVLDWIDKREKGLMPLVFEVRDMFPGNPLAQLDYIKRYGDSKTYISMLLGELESAVRNQKKLYKNYKIAGKILYDIAVAFEFAVERMDTGFGYVAAKVDDSIIKVIKTVLDEKYVIRNFTTFFRKFKGPKEIFERMEEIKELEQCKGYFEQ